PQAATASVHPLSLHDALPIFGTRIVWDLQMVNKRRSSPETAGSSGPVPPTGGGPAPARWVGPEPRTIPQSGPGGSGTRGRRTRRDRKSTRLNSSHVKISYAAV